MELELRRRAVEALCNDDELLASLANGVVVRYRKGKAEGVSRQETLDAAISFVLSAARSSLQLAVEEAATARQHAPPRAADAEPPRAPTAAAAEASPRVERGPPAEEAPRDDAAARSDAAAAPASVVGDDHEADRDAAAAQRRATAVDAASEPPADEGVDPALTPRDAASAREPNDASPASEPDPATPDVASEPVADEPTEPAAELDEPADVSADYSQQSFEVSMSDDAAAAPSAADAAEADDAEDDDAYSDEDFDEEQEEPDAAGTKGRRRVSWDERPPQVFEIRPMALLARASGVALDDLFWSTDELERIGDEADLEAEQEGAEGDDEGYL